MTSHFSKEDAGHDGSWVSLFSLVSRPAASLMQKYLPGRGQAAFDTAASLDPSLRVAYLGCRRENAGDPGSVAWLTRGSLSELGIKDTLKKDLDAQRQSSVGYLGTARNFLSQVLTNVQGKNFKTEGVSRVDTAAVCSTNIRRWDGLEGGPQNWLLSVGQSTETGTCGRHCVEHHSVAFCHGHTQAAVAMTTELCVCRVDGTLESAGHLCSKEPFHNAGLRTESLANSQQLPLVKDRQQNDFQPPVCCRAFSEVAVLTPDQDNGYSSLEEEHSNSRLRSMRLLSEEQEVSDGHDFSGEGSSQSHGAGDETVERSSSEPVDCEEEPEKDSELTDTEKTSEGTSAEDIPVLPAPQCQNKNIAYIMGSPCSGESESEDDSDWDSNDDDGFDSEGSSHLSESEDDSDDESDEDEEETDSERLWNSLCQNSDPYNPRNFTAPMRTASKPNPATESPASESPPAQMSSHLSPTSPPLSENESSEEMVDVDEDENLRLWNSFSCSADPYSLLNFQAPIQTQKAGQMKSGTPCYKGEEAEERLDSGFSEVSSVPSCSSVVMGIQQKKVHFVEEVEEFYASSDEDRHGPWEEMARDRCRFQRRVQEVEETISFCLSPTFRLDVFHRLFNAS